MLVRQSVTGVREKRNISRSRERKIKLAFIAHKSGNKRLSF